jgi:hypothetical protein
VDVSKIVRSRLGRKAAHPADGHPDPNVLAAFAERSLLERERAYVSAHLAECMDCREYLALAFATPEPEAAGAVTHTQHTSVRHWFRTWRWFVTAAAACCVIGVALQYYVEPPAREKPRPADIIASRVSPVKAPDVAEVTSAAKQKVEHQPVKAVRQVLLSKRLDASAKDQGKAALEQPALEARQPLPSANENAQKPAEAVAMANSAEAAAASDYSAGPEANATTALLPMNRDAAQKTKGALAKSRMKLALADSIVSPALSKTSAAPAILWSINTTPEALSRSFGVVQRSRDRGRTWEVIPLNDRVSFRAVTASGNDVWAGGSNASLFHSSDGGSHWMQIAISDEAVKPTGAIVSIDARDPNQVRITTSSGEQWTSTDSGSHWTQE